MTSSAHPSAELLGSADLLDRAVRRVRERSARRPQVAIILGSGLGGLADQIVDAEVFDFADLPGFGRATAEGHRGQLFLGDLNRVPVVVLAGRLHRYEGYDDCQVAFPIRLMAALGAKRLIVSNAVGGLNPLLRVGDFVIIHDHLDLVRRRWAWSAATDREPGPRSIECYDPGLIERALAAGRAGDFRAIPGIYVATLGPTFETRAEYRMFRRLGGDVVGMSMAPETRMAFSLGMTVLGLSVVSNVARPDSMPMSGASPTDHQEVLGVGRAAVGKLRRILDATLGGPVV